MGDNAAGHLVSSLQETLHTRQPHCTALPPGDLPTPSKSEACKQKILTMCNTPMLDVEGQVLYILHQLEDETGKVTAELELKQGHELLKTTIDSSLDMIQVFKALRDESGEIIDFKWILNNRTAESIYGDVVGKSLLEHNPGVVTTGIFETFKQVVETGIPDQSERHYVHEQFNGWFHQFTVKLDDGVATTTRNITKRKEAEQELRKTKESLLATQDQLQLVLSNTASSIMLLEPIQDADGHIIDFEYRYTNDQLIRSVNRVSLIGKRIAEEFPGIKQTEFFQHYIQVATEGGSWSGETQINFDGFDVWAQVYASRIQNYLLVTYFGITERKKAEQELLQSKNLLQGIIDAPNVGMAVYKALRDKKGKIVNFEHEFINRSTLEALGGYDMTGKLLSEHGEAGSKQIEEFSNVLETGLTNSYVIQRELLGSNRWILISNARLDSERLVHVWDDITEQKEKEQEVLRLKEEIAQRATDKYHTLFDAIEEGLSICSLVRNEAGQVVDLRYEELNQAMEQLTGLSRRHFIRKKLSEVLPEADAKRWIPLFAGVGQSRKPATFEEYTELLNRWCSISVYPMGEEISVFYRDITDRKLHEKRQNLLLRLNDAIRHLNDPVAIMATVSEMVGRHYNVGRCGYAEVPPPYDHLVVERDWTNGVMQSLQGRHPLSDFSDEIIRQYRSGQTVVVEDALEDGQYAALVQAPGNTRASIAVQLMKEGVWVASFYVHDSAKRNWTQDEVELMEEIADRTWAALERAKAEETLRKSEARHRTLFDAVDEGVCLFERIPNRPDGRRDYRYVAMNPMMQAMFGIPDLSGQSIRDNFPDEAEEWYNDYDRVLETGQATRFERESLPQGIVLEMFVTRVDDGSGKLLLAVMKNITERRQRERQQNYLIKLNDSLRSTANAIEIEEKVSSIAMEYFGVDRCYYCTIEGDCSVISRDARKEGLPSVAGTYPLSSFTLFKKVIEEKVPFVVQNAAESPILDEELRQMCLQLQVISFIDVPVVKNGEAVGILCVVHSAPRLWTQAEINMAVETAERT